ncbi:uncharacterized protein LOC136040784 isoform X2 [Artemia franciscana]|uniref:uncharacterized protein LOC136040784 isoform X2 n=1 Tax=Artemia franciscana TaxID=6661 RepID=UPI0032DA04DF
MDVFRMLSASDEFQVSNSTDEKRRQNIVKTECLTTWGTSSSNAESGIGSDDNINETIQDHKGKNRKNKKTLNNEDDLVTPWTLVKQYKLPQLVLVFNTRSGVNQEEKDHGKINFTVPFLFYRKYESEKVTGKSLRLLENGRLVDTGPEVIVPYQYNGWFSLLVEAKRPTPHYTIISQLISNRVARFLTGLRLLAYRLEQPPGKRNQYIPLSIPGGQTLRILAVFQEVRGIPLPTLDGRAKPVVEKRFAQCFTQAHEVVFVPMSSQGHFYTVASKNSKSESLVYSLKQLLSTFSLPLDVRLVSGPLPNKPPNFTGLLRLQNIKKSEVILACNVTELESPRMIEVDIHCGWCLQRLSVPDRRKKDHVYEKALALCRDRGELWRKQIKASLPVFPDASSHTKLVESALCDKRKIISSKSDIPKRKFGLDFRIGSPANIVKPFFTRNSFSKIDGSSKHIRDIQSLDIKPPDLIENVANRLSISRLSLSSGCDSENNSIGHSSRDKLKNLMKFRSRSEQPKKTFPIDEGILSPYGRVVDAICFEEEEENIYAEISDFNDIEMSYL